MSDLAPASGSLSGGVHSFPLRVYYEDTDAGGIVFYANYLKFAERARTEMLRCCGVDHARLKREDDVFLAVRRATIDFVMPAKLDDALTIATRLVAAAGAAIEIAQEIRRGAQVLARVELRVACLTTAGRPRRLPRSLIAALATISRHDEPMVPAHAR